MSFPNYKNKHLAEALFNPLDFIKYKKVNKKIFPKKYLIIYSSNAYEDILKRFRGKFRIVKTYNNMIILKMGDVGIIKMSGIGSPHATTILEELIIIGGKNFLNIGTAGGLQNEGIFLCNRAIRDEGTSHHYIKSSKYAYPDKVLTKKLENKLIEENISFSVGTSWTIDAPYRETKKEVEHYKKEGVVTVEMEASALFAVAKLRNVKIASAFIVSDVLGKEWNPKFDHIDLRKSLNKLIDLSLDLLRKLK